MKEIIQGVLFALATIVVSLFVPKEYFYDFWAILLGFAAGVYVGFAVVDVNKKEYYLQWAGALVFAGIAFLGVWLSPTFLIFGWLAHGAWDALHHYRALQTKTTRWYPRLCLVYDLVIAAFLLTQ